MGFTSTVSATIDEHVECSLQQYNNDTIHREFCIHKIATVMLRLLAY